MKNPGVFFKKLTGLKLPLIYVLILTFSATFFSYMLMSNKEASGINTEKPQVAAQSHDCPPPAKIRHRLSGYKYTRPILLTDTYEQSKELFDLRDHLQYIITENISAGNITTASVYVRKLNDNEWVCINGDETYNPASLIKVPTMITYLSMAGRNPKLLDEQYVFNKPKTVIPSQTFLSQSITPGKRYSVRELLAYMIMYSDNYATSLLNEHISVPAFQKLFTDLGMPTPNVYDKNFQINITDYSKFFRILFNATYISNENADFALSLLSQVNFNEGFKKQIPADIEVAHKFGESTSPDNKIKMLHEAGIFYVGSEPYLLTVMTKGTDVKKLPSVLAQISKETYDYFSKSSSKRAI